MATDDELDFNSLEGDMDGMDFGDADFDMDFDSNKPAPPGRIALEGAKSGAKAFATSASKEVLRQMPNADELAGEAGKVADAVVDLKDHFTKEMSETTKSVKSVLRKALPFTKKIVPDKVYSKLNEITKEQEEDARKSKEEEQGEAISAELGEMFGKQARERMLERDEERANRLIDLTESKSKHKQLLAGSNAIYKELVFANNFTITTQSAWMKKTLELKYRHLYVAQESLEAFKLFGKSVEEKLEKIRGNTGLTEVQKNRLNASNIVGHVRAKSMNKIAGSVGEVFGKITDNIKKNGMSAITGKMGNLRDILDQIAGAGDMMDSVGDGGAAEIGADLAGGAAGGFLGTQFIRKNASRMSALLGKVDSASKFVGGDLQFKIEKMKNKLGAARPELMPLLDAILPGVVREKTIDNSFLDMGAEATEFDNVTRQTIVEVIPNYLSLMTKYLKDISTGEDSEELRYNPITRQLEAKSKVKADIVDRAFQSEDQRQEEVATGVGLIKGYNKYAGAEDLTYDKVDSDLAKFITNHAVQKIGMEPGTIKAYFETGEDPSDEGYIDKAFKGAAEPEALAEYLTATFFDANGKLRMQNVTEINHQVAQIRKNEQWKDVLPKMMEDFGHRNLFADNMSDGTINDEFFEQIQKYDAGKQANIDRINSSAEEAMDNAQRVERDDMDFRRAATDNMMAKYIHKFLSDRGETSLLGSMAHLFDESLVEFDDSQLTEAERELIALNGGKREQSGMNKAIDKLMMLGGKANSKVGSKEARANTRSEMSDSLSDMADNLVGKETMDKAKDKYDEVKANLQDRIKVLKNSEMYKDAVKKVNDLSGEAKKLYSERIKKACETGDPGVLEKVVENLETDLTDELSVSAQNSDKLVSLLNNKPNMPPTSTTDSVRANAKRLSEMLAMDVSLPPDHEYTSIPKEVLDKVKEMEGSRVEEEPPVVKIDPKDLTEIMDVNKEAMSDDKVAPDTDNTFHGDFLNYWEYRKVTDAALLDAVLNGGSKKGGGLMKGIAGKLGKGGSAIAGFYRDTYGKILGGAGFAGKKLLNDGLPMLGRGGKNLLDAGRFLGGKYFDTIGGIYKGGFDLAGKMFGKKGAKEKRPDFVDVYRKDKRKIGEPLAKASVLEEFGSMDGKKLKNVYSISSPVVHAETGQTLISAEDIEAVLVDYKGDELAASYKTGKGIMGKLGGVLGGAKDLIKSGMGMYGDIYGTLLKGAGKGFGKVMDMFGGKGNTKIVDKLDLIYKLLDARIPEPKKAVAGDADGDGDRDGGWRDQLSRGGRNSAGLGALSAGSKGPKGGTIDANGNEVDSDGNILSTAADLQMLMGGKLSKLKRLHKIGKAGHLGKLGRMGKVAQMGYNAVGKVGGLVKGAGTMLASSALGAKVMAGAGMAKGALVGGAVAAKGAALAGLAAVPVAGWIALAGVGVAAGGYGLFKAFSNTDAYKKLTKIRLDTYKLPSNIKTGDLEDFEDDMYDLYIDGDEIDREDWAEEFGLDYDDDKQRLFFDNWFDKRAFPAFKVYMAILKKLGIDYDDVDDMDEDDEKYQPLVDTMNSVFPALQNKLSFRHEMSVKGYNDQVKKKSDKKAEKPKKSGLKKLAGYTPGAMLANSKMVQKGVEKAKEMGRSLWGWFKKTAVGGLVDKGLKKVGISIDTSKNPYLRKLNKEGLSGSGSIHAAIITAFKIPRGKLNQLVAYADDILERLKDTPLKANHPDNLEWMAEFDLDQDNPKHTKLFMQWYSQVAKPAYWHFANLAKQLDMEFYELLELEDGDDEYERAVPAVRQAVKELTSKIKFNILLGPDAVKPKPKSTKPKVPTKAISPTPDDNKTVGKTVLDKNKKKLVVPDGHLHTPTEELMDSRNDAVKVVKHIETHKETYVNDNGEVVKAVGKGNEALGGVSGGIGAMQGLLKQLVDNTGHLGTMNDNLATQTANSTNNNVNVFNQSPTDYDDEPAIANRKVMV